MYNTCMIPQDGVGDKSLKMYKCRQETRRVQTGANDNMLKGCRGCHCNGRLQCCRLQLNMRDEACGASTLHGSAL